MEGTEERTEGEVETSHSPLPLLLPILHHTETPLLLSALKGCTFDRRGRGASSLLGYRLLRIRLPLSPLFSFFSSLCLSLLISFLISSHLFLSPLLLSSPLISSHLLSSILCSPSVVAVRFMCYDMLNHVARCFNVLCCNMPYMI